MTASTGAKSEPAQNDMDVSRRAVLSLGGLIIMMTRIQSLSATARSVNLPKPIDRDGLPVAEAIRKRRSVRKIGPRPLSLGEVSQLLWAAQGITDPRGFRTAPSAGALYPLEIYLVAGNVTGLDPGIYKYGPRRQILSTILDGNRMPQLTAAAYHQDCVGGASAALVICAVYERLASKYGDRAVRYAHIEVGHAAQNGYLQAASLNLGTVIVGSFNDDGVRQVVNGARDERPLAIMPVGQAAGDLLR